MGITREAKIPFSAMLICSFAVLLILISAISVNAQTDGLEDLEPVPTPGFDALPTLQPITRQNVASMEILFAIRCDAGFATPLLGIGNNVRDISMSFVDNQLVVVMEEAMCIYDLNEPTAAPLVVEIAEPRVYNATFSPDGQAIYTIHLGDDTVRKWDTATGSELQTKLDAGDFGIGEFGVYDSIAFSPDGTLVATGFDFGVRLWDAQSETILVRADTGANRTVMWNRDGTRLIALGRRGLYLYTVYPGPRLFLNETRYAWSGANLVALGGPDDNLLMYLAFLARPTPTLLNIDSGEVIDNPSIRSNEFEFSPGDTFLLVGASLGGLDFYDAEQLQIIYQVEYAASESLPNFGLIDFNFDGTLLAGTTYNEVGSVNIWGVRE